MKLARPVAAIAVIGFAGASVAPAQPPPARRAAVHEYLASRTAPPFSGVVLAARGDTILFEGAYGMADADLDVPNRVDLRFGIGSVTKPITAAAALRLVDRGRLRLDASICEFLVHCPRAWRPATIRHLLSHTSGIPDLFGEMPAAPVDSTRAVIDGVTARHEQSRLRSAPGTTYSYSNFDYCLLGYAMEVAVGAPWATILAREVFAPAGMTDTEYDDVWRVLPRRARGYSFREGALRHIPYKDHAAYAAGGLVSSARDLLRFDRALSSGGLLADSTLRAMVTPGLGSYGLGWQVIPAFGRTLRNHTGGIHGFASHLARYDDGTVVVVLSNLEEEPAKATACDVAALLFGLLPTPRSAGASSCRPLP